MTGGTWSHCPIPVRFPDEETEAYREVTCPRVNGGGTQEGQGAHTASCGEGAVAAGEGSEPTPESGWAFPVRTGEAGQG